MPSTDLATVDETLVDAELDAITTPPPAAEQTAGLPADPVAEISPAEEPEPVSPVAVPDNRVDARVDPRVDAVDGRLDAVDARLAELAELIRVSADRAEAAQPRFEALEASGSKTAERLTSTEARLDSTVGTARDALTSATGRLDSAENTLSGLDACITSLQLVVSEQDRSLKDVSRTIAAEVEQHTSDALVESRHAVQLAVNSIAQLSLAMAESTRGLTEDVSAESASALLDSFRVDLDAILGQLGFVPLETDVGATFDPRRHRALKRVATADPAQDKVITQVIRDGYQSAATGRILLFADVEVGRHRP